MGVARPQSCHGSRKVRVLVDRRREVLVRGQHASGREQCGGRQGVEGRTHEYIMPWVLAMPRRRAGVLRPSMRTVVDRWAAVALRCTIFVALARKPNFSILVCYKPLANNFSAFRRLA